MPFVGLEVLTVTGMKMAVFWIAVPYNLVRSLPTFQRYLAVAIIREAAGISEILVSFTRLHGITAQKTVIS
jgi:hypothetical protein